MSQTVTAIYENGVFRPLKKVRLHERERVELSIFKENELDDTAKTDVKSSLLSNLADIASDIDLPEDLSTQHDHYLYGLPKK
jgi:predicted DNA-binding antitoxin AbrB/MazE fold protein